MRLNIAPPIKANARKPTANKEKARKHYHSKNMAYPKALVTITKVADMAKYDHQHHYATQAIQINNSIIHYANSFSEILFQHHILILSKQQATSL